MVPPFSKAGLSKHLRQRSYFGVGISIEIEIVFHVWIKIRLSIIVTSSLRDLKIIT